MGPNRPHRVEKRFSRINLLEVTLQAAEDRVVSLLREPLIIYEFHSVLDLKIHKAVDFDRSSNLQNFVDLWKKGAERRHISQHNRLIFDKLPITLPH